MPEPEKPIASSTPPTAPGELMMPPGGRPVWPTVIGIIAIVFGGLGAMQGGLTLLMPVWKRLVESLGGSEAASAMSMYTAISIYLGLAVALVAVLLLCGGIGLVRRRPWAISVLLTWCWIKIVLVLLNAALTWYMQTVQFEEMAGTQATPLPPTFATFFQALGLAVGLAWGWALPVFLLIWLRRRPVREEIAGWAAETPYDRPAPAVG